MTVTVCLNMIVRNERAVIERCLNSVKPFIDTWCIVDTGSTDGTQELIRSTMAGMPGVLHERPWRNFGHNRTEAIKLAEGLADYLFVIDADEILRLPNDYQRPQLDHAAYQLQVKFASIEYARVCLVRSNHQWRYEGVLHEYLETDMPFEAAALPGLYVEVTTQGFRSLNPRKFLDDAAVLMRALTDEPHNARYQYYLAQSWRDAGEASKALDAYDKRASMVGWEEEGWHASYQAAVLAEKLGKAPAEIVDRYLQCHNRRPTRSEPLVALATWFRLQDRFANAAMVGAEAMRIAKPADLLFVEPDCYGWRRADEYALALFYTQNSKAAMKIWQDVLNGGLAPESEIERLKANIAFCG